MIQSPSVSIVIAFHDRRDLLEASIQSVLQQSLENWELLLVDDGSTDGTDILARDHADSDSRVRYIHHPGRLNRGISATRNLGIAEARSPLIAQLDSDDVLLPEHLANLVDALERHPAAAMAYGPVERWFSWSGERADADRDFVARPLDAYDTVIDPPTLIPVMLQRKFGVPLGFVARTDAINAVGGYENEFRGVHDDQVFMSKMALRYPVYISGRCTYRYRRHPASIVWQTSAAGNKREARLRFLEWLDDYLTAHGVTDQVVREPLRQELWKSRHPRLVSAGRKIGRKLRSVASRGTS